MILAFILLFIGLVLVFLEFFLPGGVIGAIAALLLLLSVLLFSKESASLLLITLYVVGVLILVGVLIKFTLRWIKKSGSSNTIFLENDQEGYVASHFEKEYIGKRGIADSDLKPAGHVIIEKKRVQAISMSNYILKGKEIEVVDGQGAYLIVKEIKDNEE